MLNIRTWLPISHRTGYNFNFYDLCLLKSLFNLYMSSRVSPLLAFIFWKYSCSLLFFTPTSDLFSYIKNDRRFYTHLLYILASFYRNLAFWFNAFSPSSLFAALFVAVGLFSNSILISSFLYHQYQVSFYLHTIEYSMLLLSCSWAEHKNRSRIAIFCFGHIPDC